MENILSQIVLSKIGSLMLATFSGRRKKIDGMLLQSGSNYLGI